MIDISLFFRTRENKLEIFITGLSLTFTELARKGLIPEKDEWASRSKWICNKIREHTTQSDLHNLNIVLDCRTENIYTGMLAIEVINEFEIPKEKVLILMSITDIGWLDKFDVAYKTDNLAELNYCYFYDNLLKQNIDWASIEIDKPIISLASRSSENRARLTKELLDLAGDRCRASFGISNHYPVSEREATLYKGIMHPYPYPLRYGTDDLAMKDIQSQHVPPGYQLYKSLVAIIHETNDNEHTAIMLSEKSFKTFAWHQLPIFVATPGHASAIRNLGFDIFDDIFDHSYDDKIFTPHVHRMKILTIVSKFLREYPTLEDVQKLRKALWPRLVANNNRLMELRKAKTIEPWPIYG